MTYREYIEWCAYIRMENDEGKGVPKGGNWRQQKEAMMMHMALTGRKN